ncbi:MAG: hypothetical protein ACLR4Z_08500 [Butyricicoccaceae bacterium]
MLCFWRVLFGHARLPTGSIRRRACILSGAKPAEPCTALTAGRDVNGLLLAARRAAARRLAAAFSVSGFLSCGFFGGAPARRRPSAAAFLSAAFCLGGGLSAAAFFGGRPSRGCFLLGGLLLGSPPFWLPLLTRLPFSGARSAAAIAAPGLSGLPRRWRFGGDRSTAALPPDGERDGRGRAATTPHPAAARRLVAIPRDASAAAAEDSSAAEERRPGSHRLDGDASVSVSAHIAAISRIGEDSKQGQRYPLGVRGARRLRTRWADDRRSGVCSGERGPVGADRQTSIVRRRQSCRSWCRTVARARQADRPW